MIFDKDDPATREAIDAFKATRLQDIHRMAAYQACTHDYQMCFRFWVEQMGDAELYEQAAEEAAMWNPDEM